VTGPWKRKDQGPRALLEGEKKERALKNNTVPFFSQGRKEKREEVERGGKEGKGNTRRVGAGGKGKGKKGGGGGSRSGLAHVDAPRKGKGAGIKKGGKGRKSTGSNGHAKGEEKGVQRGGGNFQLLSFRPEPKRGRKGKREELRGPNIRYDLCFVQRYKRREGRGGGERGKGGRTVLS